MAFPSAIVSLAPLPGWFAAHGRRLPWRAEDLDLPHPDPYAVLVSELMLQQTQVATVVPYFNRWMARFRDPQELSLAQDDDVHKLWEGLGYYRRARFLKQAATLIARDGWPENLKGLQALPGLGSYTAAAIAAIAFQQPEPALDGNAFRVMARLQGILDDPRLRAVELREWLRPALLTYGPSRLTQAVMELGALVCGTRPDCAACPLAATCTAFQQGLANRIPPPRERSKVTLLDLWLVAIEAEDHWLLLKPAAEGLLAGLWRWPGFERVNDLGLCTAAESSVPYLAADARTWAGWSQSYSHRMERVSPVAIRVPRIFPAPPGAAWIPKQERDALPLGKRDQRLRDLLGEPTDLPVSGIPLSQLIQWVMAGRP